MDPVAVGAGLKKAGGPTSSAAFRSGCVALGAFVLAGSSRGVDDGPSLHARAGRSVVLLRIFAPSGTETGPGSGFVVAKGRVVTSHRLVRGASRITVVTAAKDVLDAIEVLAEDGRNDLAVLRIGSHTLPPLEIAERAPRVGERIVVPATPLAPGTLRAGVVSSLLDKGLEGAADPGAGGVPLFRTNAPVSRVSGGAPVVDGTGRVVGMATASVRHGESLDFAIPGPAVNALLRRVETERPLRKLQTNDAAIPDSLPISFAVLAGLLVGLWAAMAMRRTRAAARRASPSARRDDGPLEPR